MNTPSTTHLVLIPSYNPGAKVYETVRSARAHWTPVWVVVDGSTDGSGDRLQAMAAADPGLHVIVLARNQGKGAAVLHGLDAAAAAGFTHVLTMDSDGQHPADRIAAFMDESARHPEAMILGVPVFDADAPSLRVGGQKDIELVGESRNAVGRHRRLLVRLSRLSGQCAAPRDAPSAMDAPLRL